MKQLVVLFLLLFGGFLGTWTYKIETPVNRPDEYAEGYDETAGAWWNTSAAKVDDNWQLDSTIPLDYMPVPGQENLYMVINPDGSIAKYRKRTKQIDGSWTWEDVNPDIPDNYEPVDGLENVYKVTEADGSVKYLKYIRNDDDTFAFVEVDEKGNEINKNKDATTIDGKHVHITGNIYSELNDNGVVIGYDKRTLNEDGSYSWTPAELPESYTTTSGQNNSLMDQMAQNMQDANNAAASGSTDVYNISVNENPGTNNQTQPYGTAEYIPETPTIVNNSDGTHTEIETVRETKTIDGYTSTFETIVKKTYDADGNLISSQSEGPTEINSTPSITKETEPIQGDKSKKEKTIDNEAARVCGNYSYNTSVGNQVFALMNAERASEGMSALQISDTATKIAQLRAADMAGYDTSNEELPTYGSLGTMLSDYKISSNTPGENLWKSVVRSAEDIQTRFQTLDSARKTRMQSGATQYGIAIVEKNGYYYICEVIL